MHVLGSLFQGFFYDQDSAIPKWASQVPDLGYSRTGAGQYTWLALASFLLGLLMLYSEQTNLIMCNDRYVYGQK